MNAQTKTVTSTGIEIADVTAHSALEKGDLYLPGNGFDVSQVVPYKIERKVKDGNGKGVIKYNYMFAPDPRGRDMPHNHPTRRAVCTLISGWYIHEAWWRLEDGTFAYMGKKKFDADDPATRVNILDYDLFHSVEEVSPDGCHSVMEWTPRVEEADDWGVYDVKAKRYVSSRDPKLSDPTFGPRIGLFNKWLKLKNARELIQDDAYQSVVQKEMDSIAEKYAALEAKYSEWQKSTE